MPVRAQALLTRKQKYICTRFFIVKIHTLGPMPLLTVLHSLSLPHFSMISQPWTVRPYACSSALAPDPTISPPLEKMPTASSMAWVEAGPKGPSVGTGQHSVQVVGSRNLPIGISKQDIRETGLQHVQGQKGGLLHHLEEKRPRDENLR